MKLDQNIWGGIYNNFQPAHQQKSQLKYRYKLSYLNKNQKRRFPDYELIILAKALQVPTFYITDGVPLTYMR